MSNEERLIILEMLKEGKITAEEAMALLDQVQDKNEDKNEYEYENENEYPHRYYRRQNWERRQPRTSYRPDFGWINDLRGAVEETVQNALFADDLRFGTEQEKFVTSANIGNEINALVFEGKNAAVKLESYGGDRIEVEAYYKVKNHWNPHFMLTEENGVFQLNYDDNALYSLGISIRVPERMPIGSVRLKNRNAPISVDDIEAGKIELSTKNESIKVSDTKGDYLYCESKNASIVLDAVEMREIDTQTANAKIALEDVAAFHARLVTSNAKIDIKDSDIVQLYARTSDSSLRFDNLGYNEQEPNCSIDAITSNGQISIYLPHRELKCKLRASTTTGGIFSELNDLEYQVNERNYVEAQTRDYETAPNKLNLNLQTTNSGIYIKQ